MKCVVVFFLVFSAGFSFAGYRKAATWQASARPALEEVTALASDSSGPGGIRLGPWYLAGPYEGDKKLRFKTVFPPMKEAIAVDKPCGGKKWTPRPDLFDGSVHMLKAGSWSAHFLTRTILSPKEQTITGYFGSDDGMKAWLNDQLIISHDVPRGPGPNQERAKLKLRQGENRLTMMPFNNSGGHGFYFSTDGRPGSRLQHAQDDIWRRVQNDFPEKWHEIDWEKKDGIWAVWKAGDFAQLAGRYLKATRIEWFAKQVTPLVKGCKSEAQLDEIRRLYHLSRWVEEAEQVRGAMNFPALLRALASYDGLPQAADLQKEVEDFQEVVKQTCEAAKRQEPSALKRLMGLTDEWQALQRRVLLANPALDFEKIVFIKRRGASGLSANWQGNDRLERGKYDNGINTFKLRDPAEETLVYKPETPMFVGDVDLHWNARKMMFSTNGVVREVGIDGENLRDVVTEINSSDPCYLPDGRLLFCSNSGYHAVPCVSGSDYVGNLHIANADGTGIRRLCFDQDNNWSPCVLENGRVMYTRWEYTDSAHYFSRLLFHMNPDGTGQMEFYGSNSYWPNSIFYARQLPGFPTKFVAIVSGHHGVARAGELVIFDSARDRHEANGAIQKIPGWGKKVEAVTMDNLIGRVWPRFVHPWPLDDKTFLVSCKPTSRSPWGIYLVDVYDNMLLLKSEPGYHCMEPIPLKARPVPPKIADRVQLGNKEANVYIQDVYIGQAMEGVPKGTVKRLRLFQYEYSYRNVGGHNVVGYEGPWDVRRLLGTVPVKPDGSAFFKIPANVPLAIQPLDAEGKALAIMRSWFVGMPGENVSCVGCHEKQNEVAPSRRTLASAGMPVAITPWYGEKRGFSFRREVQPVLDRSCVGCHDGSKPNRPVFKDDGKTVGFSTAQNRYSKPYLELARFVRRNGPEGDYHVLTPLEFHADTSELVQILQKGHYGVKLDTESWDRIITWIDLNVPYFGTWKEAASRLKDDYVCKRYENRLKYANVDEDIEAIPNPYKGDIAYVPPQRVAKPEPAAVKPLDGWPFEAAKAVEMQGGDDTLDIDLGNGEKLVLVRVPAGRFLMGKADGCADEAPVSPVEIKEAFWMLRGEISNAQYAAFDPQHDSGVYDMRWKDQVNRGYFVNQPDKPAIRVSWDQAMEFCRWLSDKTGRVFTLPSEAEWEWACRAGTATDFSFKDADFAGYANLADVTTKKLVVTGVNPRPVRNPHPLASYLPAVFSSDDKTLHLAPPATYQANAWGLYDLHGNVAEWTRSLYRSYPYRAEDGREELEAPGKRVVRGGSWHDRPKRARSSFRLAYPAWQRVFNVGFRVISPVEKKDFGKRAAR